MILDVSSSESGLRDIRQRTLGDTEICVAVIDSRVDFSHPCFVGAQLRELMPNWLRSVMGSSGASHGTHVASVIFGQPGGSVEGIAPKCRGVVIPVYGETEGGDLRPCSQEDLARAISLALEAGAHLINISGGELIRPGDVDPFLAQVARSCDQQDVAIIAATGNEGCECLHVPASLPTVLAVGAADANGHPMQFSNWDQSLTSHGVLAPGEGISGAVPGNGVAVQTGTSFACPIVTGAAALLLSLQKLHGERPSPKAVRDAIIASANPCRPEVQEPCERMLAGLINIPRAYELLFKSNGVSPSLKELRKGALMDAIRLPPTEIAPIARPPLDEGNDSFANYKEEGMVMANKQILGRPPGTGRLDQGVAPQGFEAPQTGMQACPSVFGARVPTGGSMPTTPMATEAQQVGAEGQTAVQPQSSQAGGCSCGGAHAPQGMSSAQQEGLPAQQPSVVAHQGGIPMQAPYGVTPTSTPAQRTATLVGLNGSMGAQQRATTSDHGVAPSQTQTACTCPMPTDFINTSNSQLVYVTGLLGYDFITDARRDYFVQQFRAMSEDHDFISQFTADLALQPGPLYLPEDNRAMAAYLTGVRTNAPKGGKNPEDTASLVWILLQEGQPLYALRPLQTLAFPVLLALNAFLYDQSRPEFLDEKYHLEPNPDRSDRLSVAGRILGDITLYNGQRVPVLDLSARALFNWNLKVLLDDVLGKRPDHPDQAAAYDANYERLKNFLERIYYEIRNLGQAPSERAINYLTTNLYQANQAFTDALKDKLELDSIFAEKSPLCRPKSDCWDVIMRFFDPNNRLGKALVEYRLTVDVSDISPVGIGKVRRWARYA